VEKADPRGARGAPREQQLHDPEPEENRGDLDLVAGDERDDQEDQEERDALSPTSRLPMGSA